MTDGGQLDPILEAEQPSCKPCRAPGPAASSKKLLTAAAALLWLGTPNSVSPVEVILRKG